MLYYTKNKYLCDRLRRIDGFHNVHLSLVPTVIPKIIRDRIVRTYDPLNWNMYK